MNIIPEEYSVNYRLRVLLLALLVVMLPSFTYAQPEKEMETLQMYFSEDQLVTTPTRTLKPISQVAENIAIVTAEEIEKMNAHNLAEVLEKVTGVYVDYMRNDFYEAAYYYIQGNGVGTDYRHVLLMLDGVSLNYLSDGNPETTAIPIGIIKRIEVIKGPSSSVWGSSLGGVVNIVTKDAGNTAVPSGTVSASFGEKHSRDYNGVVAGKAGIAGYYLYAGRYDSDGLRRNRYYERNSFYGKLDIPFNQDVKLLLVIGDIETVLNNGDYIEDPPETNPSDLRTVQASATLFAAITDNLRLEASYYEFMHKFSLEIKDLFTGEFHQNTIEDDKSRGASARFIWTDNKHNAILGFDVSHGNMDLNRKNGPLYLTYGYDDYSISSGISKWAVFANDTISIGDLSITPALRYDKSNISGDFTSPSLGATYKIGRKTVLRASAARGFTAPPLTFEPKASSLKPEKVWSYQAGAETLIGDYLKTKVNFFKHDMTDAIEYDWDVFKYVNKNSNKRIGMELDAETVPVYNMSVRAGFSYVRKKITKDPDPTMDDVKTIYDYNIIFKYDDMRSLSALLSGNYTWWDGWSDNTARYNTFIWNLNLDKEIYSREKIKTDIFLTVHNLSNASYYDSIWHQNPRRWMEGGVRVNF